MRLVWRYYSVTAICEYMNYKGNGKKIGFRPSLKELKGKQFMRKKGLLLIAIVVGVRLGLLYAVSAAPASATCTVTRFEATVRDGKSTGTTYSGRLTLDADVDGGLTGVLAPSDGSASIRVVGQADGRSINLAFDLGTDNTGGNQQYLFAVGTLWNPFGQCSGAMGGPFVGPLDGDSGEWSVRGS